MKMKEGFLFFFPLEGFRTPVPGLVSLLPNTWPTVASTLQRMANSKASTIDILQPSWSRVEFGK